MKNRMRMLAAMLAFGLAMTGCGSNTKEETTAAAITKAPLVSSEAAKEETTAAVEVPEIWNPAVGQRQMLFDEGYEAGVLFLGYVDGSAGDLEHDKDYYQSLFEEQGYLEEFPFLAEIPNSNFVQTEYGQELYCIIPQDDMATVSVNQWIVNEQNDFKGETGEVLYRSEYGSPILVKCNVSEIVSDVQIVMVDHKGNVLQWCPYLSGMDGHVVTEATEGEIYDFTAYANDGAEILDVLIGKVYDYHWSEEYEATLASLTAPLVVLGEETAEDYPELSAAIRENISARRTKLYEYFEELIPAAEEFYPIFYEGFAEFESKEEAMVRRADSNVLSVLYCGHKYEGGAHGYTYYFGENYDPKTGELLKLEDVVLDLESFPSIVQEYLFRYWEPVYFYEDMDLNEHFKEYRDSIAWTLDYNGITVYFNPYDIAPYASGIQVVTVPFADHPELFAESYTKVPGSYGIQLDMDIPFYYDVDYDGELDELMVLASYSDDLIYKEHHIYIDENWYRQGDYDNGDYMPEDVQQVYAYEIFTPHLIHMEDGRTYLFIENLADSDFRTNTVYDLTEGTVKGVETLYSYLHTEVSEESEYLLRQALTDPNHFMMDSRTWVLGTQDGYQSYYISADGHAYSNEDYYAFDPQHTFTVIKDFRANVVDEYGIIGDAVVVKAGEEVAYYRTDASLYADLIMKNGQIVRVELQWDGGMCMIDGTYVEEIFDGIVFAG